ncbi:MAG TPA: glycosyltransferase [Bacteroidales bacterium]|nr:glycosyltransferase [Bacteroidales bacterium]
MRTLVLLTSQYPFGTGEPFLETELPVITTGFDKVIIIAQDVHHEKTRNTPGNYSIIRFNPTTEVSGYARLLFLVPSNLSIFLKTYYDELSFRKNKLSGLSVKKKIILIRKIIKGLQLKDFINKRLRSENIHGQIVFYSYWLKTSAHAIAMLHYDNCIKISRAHGSDLYEEKNRLSYLPLYSLVSSSLDAIFFISEHGKQYFIDKTGTNKSGYILSRLGVNRNEPLPIYTGRQPSIFNIVSCSNILALKRIDLIINALEKIGPGKKIHWVHFGDGILRKDIEVLAKEKLGRKTNISYSFMGQYPNHKLLEYYSTNNINLFINTSSTEGVPVSIMEAQSFGIPVIATDVGGVKEVVTEGTGQLLPVNLSTDELADKIEYFINMTDNERNIYRNNALKNWENNFNATSNYHNFITKLNSILASSTES